MRFDLEPGSFSLTVVIGRGIRIGIKPAAPLPACVIRRVFCFVRSRWIDEQARAQLNIAPK